VNQVQQRRRFKPWARSGSRSDAAKSMFVTRKWSCCFDEARLFLEDNPGFVREQLRASGGKLAVRHIFDH
jgi:hypothetical protein